MANETLVQLADRLATKREELKTILAPYKNEQGHIVKTPPADAMTDIDTRTKEINALTDEYKQRSVLEQADRDNAVALAELDKPQYDVPFPAGQPRKAATVIGYQDAGQSIVDRKALQVIYEEGDLGYDEKTLAAISTLDYKHTYRDYLRKGLHKLSSPQIKTLQEGADSQGGFLVPDDVQNRIISKMPAPTRLSSRVTQFTTSRDSVLIPKVNYTTDDVYTTGIRVKWTGEVPTSSTAHRVTDPVFGQINIPIHTAMLSMPITRDMVEDSAFPIVQWSSDKFRETVDLLGDDVVINGSGIGQPAGVLLNPGGANQPDIVKTGDANLITADGIQDIAWSLPEQYDGDAIFAFNKTSTGKAIAKLKDKDDRYLWGAGLQDSGLVVTIRNRQLVGYDVALSSLMPNVAANAFPIIFGDLSGYYLVNRIGFSIEVLRELYAETNQILLLGRIRLGGQTAEPWKLKIQKVAA